VCWLTKVQVAGMRESVLKSAVWRRYSQFKALDQCVRWRRRCGAPYPLDAFAHVPWHGPLTDTVRVNGVLLSCRALRKRYGWKMSTISFPPGKLFGNTNPKFVEKRRNSLNAYIQEVRVVFSLFVFWPLRACTVHAVWWALCQRARGRGCAACLFVCLLASSPTVLFSSHLCLCFGAPDFEDPGDH